MPGLTWGLTALSGATLAWLALEYRAMGRGTIRVETDALDVAIGRRAALRVPRTHVAAAVPAAWRDVPDAPSPGYLNATAPADPNVLLTFAPPGACEHRDGRPSALSSPLAPRSGGQVARGQG